VGSDWSSGATPSSRVLGLLKTGKEAEVDLVMNPNGFDLMHRDVTTVCAWFARRGVPCDAEVIFATLLDEAW